MSKLFAGLDFGTSNSTVGIIKDGKPSLIPVEDDKGTIPSAIFFSFEDNEVYFGRKAIGEYIDRAEGRLMRALKSVLGTSLIHDKTRIKHRSVSFVDILGMFIGHLKSKLELEVGREATEVVLGRPVHFVDENLAADAQAQRELEKAARAQGFKHIDFQFEPIAAALDYEQQVVSEELALIVDIGGGTSDFSIVRVSPERAQAFNRQEDILANVGVHIGGTDFDRLVSMAQVMPSLGYKSLTKDGKRNLPSGIYFDLATWQRINSLYAKKVMFDLRQIRYEAERPELVDRFMKVVENRHGHQLAGKVEEAKIALTEVMETSLDLSLVESDLYLPMTRSDLNKAIEESVERIKATVNNAVIQAQLTPNKIQAIFLTGGSTMIPLVKESILKMFPAAKVVEGDMFGSVGLGLALDAKRKFG